MFNPPRSAGAVLFLCKGPHQVPYQVPSRERPLLANAGVAPRNHARCSGTPYWTAFFVRGRSRKRIQAKIMLGSSYMARPTWLYLPGAILVLKDR